MSNFKNSWIRVTKRNPCPICGKPDWCMVSSDGKTTICARTESDKLAGSKGAGWVHCFSDPRPLPPVRLEPKPLVKASPDNLNQTYLALLGLLPLRQQHLDNLIHRGLSQVEINSLMYRSIYAGPWGERNIARHLEESGLTLKGVPGFFQSGNVWRLTSPIGIAIPVRDLKHRIIGIQVRCDIVSRGKYKWLSSRGLKSGCSPGAPIHIAMPATQNQGELWITEGPIKADIAALRLNRTVLAVPGVSNWPGIIPVVNRLSPKRVVVAFDMDKLKNPVVNLHSQAIMACLIKKGVQTFEADWDPKYKGLDDIMAGE